MNAATPQRIVALIQKIQEATDQDRLPWTTTSLESVFQVAGPGAFIQVAEEYDQDAQDTYHVVTLRDKNGRILDRITSGAYVNAIKQIVPDTKGYPSNVENVFRSARWKALGVSSVYDRLLSEL